MMLMRTWQILLVFVLFSFVENATAEDSERSTIQLKIGATKCSLPTWRLITENFAAARDEGDPVLSKALNLEWSRLEDRCERLEPDADHDITITGRTVVLESFGRLFEIEDGRYVWDDDVED